MLENKLLLLIQPKIASALFQPVHTAGSDSKYFLELKVDISYPTQFCVIYTFHKHFFHLFIKMINKHFEK